MMAHNHAIPDLDTSNAENGQPQGPRKASGTTAMYRCSLSTPSNRAPSSTIDHSVLPSNTCLPPDHPIRPRHRRAPTAAHWPAPLAARRRRNGAVWQPDHVQHGAGADAEHQALAVLGEARQGHCGLVGACRRDLRDVSCWLGRWQGGGGGWLGAGGGDRRQAGAPRRTCCACGPRPVVCLRALPSLLQGGECGALDERQRARPLHGLQPALPPVRGVRVAG